MDLYGIVKFACGRVPGTLVCGVLQGVLAPRAKPGMVGGMDEPWADPGYFAAGRSRLRNGLRLLWQLLRPPRGHHTRLTRGGLVLIGLTLGIGTAAFNTAQNMLYVALALLLSCLLLSGLLAWLNFSGCRWRLNCPPRARAGAPLPVEVEVCNDKRRLPTWSLRFELAIEPGADRPQLPLSGRLDAGERAVLQHVWQPAARGLAQVRLHGMSSTYPFGLLRKSIRDSAVAPVLVWPARVACQLRATGRRPPGPHSGGRRPRQTGGVELYRLRAYVRGDPPRQIHWKASARSDGLLVMENREEAEVPCLLALDLARDRWPDAAIFERLCAVAAGVAEDLFTANRLGGWTEHCGARHRIAVRADLHRLFDYLALAAPAATPAVLPAAPNRITFQPAGDGRLAILRNGDAYGEA
jgi:uncharacterized protein (DUF58 family)